MGLHPEFTESPHAILDPSTRWIPDEDRASCYTSINKLIPPLVEKLRIKVKEFRDGGYAGASNTSRSLLNWWFKEPHPLHRSTGAITQFQYFFAQREALETIIYLCDVENIKDKFDLMRFDGSGEVSAGMFDENWRRLVVKMATGSGKTKVMSLVLAWSFFHKLYEPDSTLSRNFLVITPNIIVLDRIYYDFEGLRIFFEDPVLPDNGFDGRNWRDDFQLTLHKQDEVRIIHPTGNIFLTNIHRVYSGEDIPPSPDDENSMDYFLGRRPKGATTDSTVDLGMIVRDIDELMVLNDEAHHVHDSGLAWFKSIEDIHNRLLQKGGSLALQVDVTATPKRSDGSIFVQTVSDYPLVEAISQNVVKRPVLPDADSREKLSERQSTKYTEKYADYIDLGVVEWRKAYAQHEKLGKKSILFVMTDDTRNCDDVAEYLETRYPDLKNAVMVIHTKRNGEISESSSGRNKKELEKLREQSNKIDSPESPYKAIVSVLMLKEGWDVRNVTTIVGLRAYSARSNILPEQTLGRGLRRMYPEGSEEEYVSVVGTNAFMDFVESIQAEGVELERAAMGQGAQSKMPLVIEIDKNNAGKDIDALDIEIPLLSPRIYRKYENLSNLNIYSMGHQRLPYRQFSEEEKREIIFRDIVTDEVVYTTILDEAGVADYRGVVGYFARTIIKELRLVSGYDVLFGKIKAFVQTELFDRTAEIEAPNTCRNLSEPSVTKTLINTFKKAINDLTVLNMENPEVRDTIKLSQTRPFIVKDQKYTVPGKSVFNIIVGDSGLELRFANFLEKCPDVMSYAKNYLAVNFRLDYVNAEGQISNYYPDFLVKLADKKIVIVETKGLEDLDVPLKMARLRQWCEDCNRIQSNMRYDFAFVDQEGFEKYTPSTFETLLELFKEYK